jgi:outer membrane protein assembly factor BamB
MSISELCLVRFRRVGWWLLPLLTVGPAAALGHADGAIGWRGDGSGMFPEARPPLRWTGPDAGNVRWKTEVGAGMSSPVVVGGRVLVTAEPDLLVCLDRQSGKLLWKQSTRFSDLPPGESVKPGKPPPTSCGYTTPTPVSDGQRVCVVFGTGLVACYDLEGRRQWVHYLGGDRMPQYGRSASPVIVEGKLVVHLSALQGLDLQTGRLLWKADRTREGYSSPAVTRVGDVPVLVTAGGDVVRARDGKVLASGLGRCEYVTPLCRGRAVFFIDADARAVELPEQAADTIKVESLWTQDLDGEFIASPVVDGGLVYTVNTTGTFYVLDATTGKIVIEKELSLPAPEKSTRVAKCYPSVTLAGTLLFVGDDGGGSLWLRPGRAYNETGRNLLPQGAAGSPVFAGGRLYLRGGSSLYCISEK